jgi:hypothetical protein
MPWTKKGRQMRGAAIRIHANQKKAPCCLWALVALTHTTNLLQDYLDAWMLLCQA